MFNLINHELDTDEIYSYAKDPYEAKYQLLIKKRESTGLKYLNLNYSKDLLNTQMIWMISMKIMKNTIQIKNYQKLFIILYYMIADMLINKKTLYSSYGIIC